MVCISVLLSLREKFHADMLSFTAVSIEGELPASKLAVILDIAQSLLFSMQTTTDMDPTPVRIPILSSGEIAGVVVAVIVFFVLMALVILMLVVILWFSQRQQGVELERRYVTGSIKF